MTSVQGHLIRLVLIERQILPTTLLYLSAFFASSRRDHCDGLRGIRERGQWTSISCSESLACLRML